MLATLIHAITNSTYMGNWRVNIVSTDLLAYILHPISIVHPIKLPHCECFIASNTHTNFENKKS